MIKDKKVNSSIFMKGAYNMLKEIDKDKKMTQENKHMVLHADLSNTAKAVYAGHWQLMKNNEVTFQRPWVISDKMKQGLDELVEYGFLVCEKTDNRHSSAITYKATEKLKRENLYFNVSFLREHGAFPIIDETKERKKL